MNRILRQFDHDHLPGNIAAVALLFQELAYRLDATPIRETSKSDILIKLLHAKDSFVRVAITSYPTPDDSPR